VLGSLFRYETRTRNKTNLMVFLQPRIIRSAEDSRDLSASRYDFVIGEQVKTGENAKLLPGEPPPPVLRPFQEQSPPALTTVPATPPAAGADTAAPAQK
jgi:general secretion pathway protein D